MTGTTGRLGAAPAPDDLDPAERFSPDELAGVQLDRLRATVDMPVRVVRLTLPQATVRERLGVDPTAALTEELARTEAWAADEASGPLAVPADLVVANDGTVEATAAAILGWLDWLPASLARSSHSRSPCSQRRKQRTTRPNRSAL